MRQKKLGRKLTEEHKEKIWSKTRGQKRTLETIEKMRNRVYKPASEETREMLKSYTGEKNWRSQQIIINGTKYGSRRIAIKELKISSTSIKKGIRLLKDSGKNKITFTVKNIPYEIQLCD